MHTQQSWHWQIESLGGLPSSEVLKVPFPATPASAGNLSGIWIHKPTPHSGVSFYLEKGTELGKILPRPLSENTDRWFFDVLSFRDYLVPQILLKFWVHPVLTPHPNSTQPSRHRHWMWAIQLLPSGKWSEWAWALWRHFIISECRGGVRRL